MPPLAVRAAKRAVRRASEAPLADGLAAERDDFFALFDTADQAEGMARLHGEAGAGLDRSLTTDEEGFDGARHIRWQ